MIFIWYPNKQVLTVRMKSFGSKVQKIFSVTGQKICIYEKESMILGLLFLIGFSFKSKLTLDFSLLNKSCRRTCTTYSFRLFKRPANNSNFYKVGFVCLFRQHNIPNGKLENFSIKNCNQTLIFEQMKKILRDRIKASIDEVKVTIVFLKYRLSPFHFQHNV